MASLKRDRGWFQRTYFSRGVVLNWSTAPPSETMDWPCRHQLSLGRLERGAPRPFIRNGRCRRWEKKGERKKRGVRWEIKMKIKIKGSARPAFLPMWDSPGNMNGSWTCSCVCVLCTRKEGPWPSRVILMNRRSFVITPLGQRVEEKEEKPGQNWEGPALQLDKVFSHERKEMVTRFEPRRLLCELHLVERSLNANTQ